MNRRVILWLFSMFGMLVVLGLAGDRHQGESSSSCPALVPSTLPACDIKATPAEARQKVSVDPATGQIIPASPQARPVLSPNEQNAISTSGDGLREEPGKTRAGGVKVHLQGRFRSSVVATLGVDGRPITHCVTQPEANNPNTTR